MLVTDVIALAMQRVNMSFSEIGDGNATTGESRAYQYLNMVKDEVWSKIVASTTGKDLSWEEWTQTFTALQTEYALPQVVSDENRLKKIQSLSITYGTDTYDVTGELKYTPAKFVDRASLPQDWGYYVNMQPQSEPIYCVGDKSIFVAPATPTTITAGLKLTGVKKIPDYDSNTSESDMVIPDDYHYLLVDGLEVQFLYKQGQRGMAMQQKQNFQQSTQGMLTTQRDTHIGPMHLTYPDDEYNFNRNNGTNTYQTLP